MSFEVKFKLTSESDIQASVEKMYFDLYVNDTNVGFISETKSFVLPAHGSSVVPLTISINPQSILKNLLSLSVGIGKNKDFMFKMDGYAKVRSGFVVLTLPIKYETSFKEYLKTYFPSFGI
jgi:LEA14-like dessication related protein